MWSFKFLTALIIALPASIFRQLLSLIAESSGAALTTANLKDLLLSWRAPLIFVIGMALIMLYIVMEIFAQVHLSNDILNGRRARILPEVVKGVRSMRKFMNPAGLLVLLYIFIAVPLCGIGFSISLTQTFYIPNFILDVVLATPLYAVAYAVVIVLLIWLGYRSIFTVHAVLIDGMSPTEGRRKSVQIIKAHQKQFIFGMLKTLLLMLLIQAAVDVVFTYLPCAFLEHIGASLPKGYQIDLDVLSQSAELSDTEAEVIVYRCVCSFVVMMGIYLNYIAVLLTGSYTMLRFTRYYLDFAHDEASDGYLERPKKTHYRWKVISMVGMAAMLFLFSFVMGVCYNEIFDTNQSVNIIAHRAGGTMAAENSVEGLNAAIEHNCYASEIDVQRTKDGYYIINHDNDFKRLTGVDKTPQEMTLEEIRNLQVKDTTGGGTELQVATIEEMLDAIKGRGKLFIELKGATADNRMVDDLVQIIREKDCVEDVVLISLSYGVIDYAETTYSNPKKV